MLINLHANVENDGVLQLNIPRLTFDQRFNYKIGITHVNYRTSRGTLFTDNELLCINTNVIDLSVQNPTQSLLHFPFNAKRTIQNIRPSIVLYQSLQLYEFENASFELRRFHSNELVKINSIFIQLEIIRLDAYGRLQ